ncbi:MAG TPA: nuclear transport factor 2 family protein [Novosphingobium sp.]|nr:nuclear transport factor 2 family protein [Novosphingobium sp.]
MDDLQRLLAIEAIKQVKARYFYGFDHKDWDMWRDEVWAPDGELHVPELRAEPFRGFEAVLAYCREAAADQVSVHHGHMPIIDFVSDTEAKVIWAMEDLLFRTPAHPLHDGSSFLHGYGHYRETYVKLERGWRLKTCQLTRLRVDMRKSF